MLNFSSIRSQRSVSRRQAYRVPVPDLGEIKLSVKVAGWPAIAGRICDATADGLGVMIPMGIHLPVEQGERLHLTVWIVSDNRAITMDAKVITVHEEGDARRYGVRFLMPDRARRELSQVLGIVFNRRSAPRVAPAEGAQVVLRTLEDGGDVRELELSGALLDISETGLRVRCALGAPELASGTPCLVTLRLHPEEPGVDLPGQVCRRSHDAGRQGWGISLNRSAEGQADTGYERFRSYVIDRTRQALQAA
jgi:c-di-GMP-binding flagellar brake protein YcgR